MAMHPVGAFGALIAGMLALSPPLCLSQPEVTCALEISPPVAAIGERLEVRLKICNASDRAICLPGSVDASENGVRLPSLTFEVTGDALPSSSPGELSCPNLNALRAGDFWSLEPGQCFEPFGARCERAQFSRSLSFRCPGTARITFRYSTLQAPERPWLERDQALRAESLEVLADVPAVEASCSIDFHVAPPRRQRQELPAITELLGLHHEEARRRLVAAGYVVEHPWWGRPSYYEVFLPDVSDPRKRSRTGFTIEWRPATGLVHGVALLGATWMDGRLGDLRLALTAEENSEWLGRPEITDWGDERIFAWRRGDTTIVAMQLAACPSIRRAGILAHGLAPRGRVRTLLRHSMPNP